jgi:hypothetical protein
MRVKGSALAARERWIRAQGGEAFEALRSALSPPAREALEAGFLASAWYEYEIFVEILETLDRLHGKGDGELCYELGRWACDANLTTLYRLFFRLGNPHFLIRRSAAAWRTHYDAGDLVLLDEEEKAVTLEIRDVPRPTRAHCLSVLGWTVRACEISGAEVIEDSIRMSCRADGDERCILMLAWR